MRKAILATIAVGTMLVPTLPVAPALAQLNKSYVANFGGDGNSCADVLHACATFAGALAKTNPGGEISVVNTGDYGVVTIDKSVNVTNDGAGESSILSPSGMAAAIGAGAGDIISLRGLVIDGQGPGSVGIQITQASAVHVQNCVIRNFESPVLAVGILMVSAGNTKLFVSDTIIFNNGNAPGSGGIVIAPQGTGSSNVILDRVHLENNVIGLRVLGSSSTADGAHVVLRDSVVSGNAGDGIVAFSDPGKAPAFILVQRTSSVNNTGIGINAFGPRATMLLNDNTVARNGVGISASSSGQLISYGNNRVNNNLGPDGTPTSSYTPL